MRNWTESTISMVTTKQESICRCDKHPYPKSIPRGSRALRIHFVTNRECVAHFCTKCIPHMIEQMKQVIMEETEHERLH